MLAAGLAVTYAGFVLFVFPDRAEDLFTWNIQPPITAAFLGAMYVSGTPLLLLVARRGTSWLQVRAVLPPFVTVSVGMLIVTLVHSDRFIWSSPVTWLWLALYAIFPPLVIALYVRHARQAPAERESAGVEMGPQFRAGAATIGASLAVSGLALFVAPRTFDGLWPWPLTPLTAGAIGAWLLSLGVALGAVAREHDWAAIRLIAPQGVLVAALLLAGVARFHDTFEWNDPVTWVYVGGVAIAFLGGVLLLVTQEARWRTAIR
jgi:hypothetical protein